MAAETCDLVGPFSFFVQAMLGVLSFFVLIIKRFREKPKRQWKIWSLDTSKQLASALVAHLLNLTLSIMLSSDSDADPCLWYFVTVMFDTTIGVGVCYLLLMRLENQLTGTTYEKYKSGNYFSMLTPDQAIRQNNNKKRRSGSNENENLDTNLLRPVIVVNIGIWLAQLIIWNTIVVLSKTILYFIQMALQDTLLSIAGWIFQSVTNKDLELVIVMAIVPVCMNGLQVRNQDSAFILTHRISLATILTNLDDGWFFLVLDPRQLFKEE